MDCPGCGFQRSAAALLRGDIAGSLSLYPALIPIACLALVTILHLTTNLKYGALLIKYLQISIGIIIGVFYIYKLITLKVFD